MTLKLLLNILMGLAAAIVLAATFYFFPVISGFTLCFGIIAILAYYVIKFAKMIMILEDDLGNAIESLNTVEKSMEKLIAMKLYFDTPEVAQFVNSVMDSVKMARFSVNKMIEDLTSRSKDKWILVMEEDEISDEDNESDKEMALLKRKEGTLFSVEREKNT